jgi:uncharacterized protein (TIGR02466 family)
LNEYVLFPTIVREYDFSKDPDFHVLADFVSKQKTEPHRLVGWAESSYGVGRSLFSNFILAGMRQKIQAAVDDYVAELGIAPVKLTNSWFNKLGQQQRVEVHRHELSVVSGALYVHADPTSAGLKLFSPLAQLRMYEKTINHNSINANFIEMSCRTGQLILFPSWLEHGTDINQTNSRITVSFNTEYC